jgi:hypothetical protein
MKPHYTAKDEVEAHLVVLALTAAGIPATTEPNQLSGAAGEVPWHEARRVRVLVPEARAEEARRVLASFLRERHTDGGNWTCPNCREPNPTTFDSCWSCGATNR